MRADLVRAARSRAGPAAASSRGSACSISKCVTASRGTLGVGRDHACGAGGRGRAARRSCPMRDGGRPSTSARYSRVIARRCSAAFSARWVGSSRATTSSPDVSRSRRCTIPGRSASSPPPARPASAWTSVPVACPRAGWTTTPAGLSTTSRCVVLVGDAERRGRVVGRGPGPAVGLVDDDALAAAHAVALGHGARRRRSPARPRSGAAHGCASRAARRGRRRAARPRPQAGPGAPSPASAASAARSRRRASRSTTTSSTTTPSVIETSADVERRPVRRLDVVGHRAARDAVDDVADRAAEQHPGRKPDAGHVEVRADVDEQRDQRDGRRSAPRAPGCPDSRPNATPSFSTWTRRSASPSTSWRSPTASEPRTSAFTSWSIDDHGDRRRRGERQDAPAPHRATRGSGRRRGRRRRTGR